MKNNPFFIPSPLYKEFMLLDVIEKHDSITQRDMSSFINGSISMVNDYLNQYESLGYIIKTYHSAKKVEYKVTQKGISRKKLLNVWFLSDSQKVYYHALENLNGFLETLNAKEKSKVYLYGAGEMGELFLDVIESNPSLNWKIEGFLDDDKQKHTLAFKGLKVLPPSSITELDYDLVLITSYNHHDKLKEALLSVGIPMQKIKGFFI